MAKAAPSLKLSKTPPTLGLSRAEILKDYRICYISRQASLIGRKEVLTGKAKFGIFGDGKEVAQVAMARAFNPGDWRAGYYRDQTFMMAVGQLTVKQFFAQLYADTDLAHEPASGGRQMNSHFATRYIDEQGQWLNQLNTPNSAADLSPTAAQMAKLVGLGYASKLYRQNKQLHQFKNFSQDGQEVAFGTIGNASAAEGIFWESLNACGVLQIPVVISVWDDGYGISVPNKYQMSKDNISEVLQGFNPRSSKSNSGERHGEASGVDIHIVNGWDYPALVECYRKAVDRARTDHAPALIHVRELTQPQGHSTSGSHERYKSAERMAYEEEQDCLLKMRSWIITQDLASDEELTALEKEGLAEVEREKNAAWKQYSQPIEQDRQELLALYSALKSQVADNNILDQAIQSLKKAPVLFRRTIMSSARRTLLQLAHLQSGNLSSLSEWTKSYQEINQSRYSKWTFSETDHSPLQLSEQKAVYSEQSPAIPGNEIIQQCFQSLMARDPRVFIVGEDVGHLGGVNQEFKSLQEEFGDLRITDTGIREATIFGQGMGAAMRGLRPVVDIQYLDYLFYCLQLMSDDLATLHYRTAGGQIAPVVIRTKGHRLEGIWHSGSPMGAIINAVRGIHVCVPRNMVQAAGMYNTLFSGDDPGLVVEVLNGYRMKEQLPDNLSAYRVPLGVPEILRSGEDVTIVTYGACIRIAEEACDLLEKLGVSVELIDVQTLLPFDRYHIIAASIEKTNAVLFLDEDVPGGASAFMMREVLETQKAYDSLDAAPKCLTAKPHRSAYASDGDYWSKPSVEDVLETVYDMQHERNPGQFPLIRK